MTPDDRARLLALVEQWRGIQSRSMSGIYATGFDDGVRACAKQLAALLPPVGQEPFGKLLSIAGLVNGYHNDGTTLTAAQTLKAIADVLGDPMAPVGQDTRQASELVQPENTQQNASVGQEEPQGWQPILVYWSDSSPTVGPEAPQGQEEK